MITLPSRTISITIEKPTIPSLDVTIPSQVIGSTSKLNTIGFSTSNPTITAEVNSLPQTTEVTTSLQKTEVTNSLKATEVTTTLQKTEVTRSLKATEVTSSLKTTDVTNTQGNISTLQKTSHTLESSNTKGVPIPIPTFTTIDISSSNVPSNLPFSIDMTSTCQIISIQPLVEATSDIAIRLDHSSISTISTVQSTSNQQEPRMSQSTLGIMPTPSATSFEEGNQQSKAHKVFKTNIITITYLLNYLSPYSQRTSAIH